MQILQDILQDSWKKNISLQISCKIYEKILIWKIRSLGAAILNFIIFACHHSRMAKKEPEF